MKNKSIVLTGGMSFGSTTFGIAQGFRKLGWDVHEINLSQFFPQYNMPWLKMAGRILAPLAAKDYNQAIIRSVAACSPQAFLAVKGSYINPQTLIAIAQMGVPRVNYYPDYKFTYREVNEATFPYYSKIYTTKSFQIPYLIKTIGREKVDFLPHGYQPDTHRPPTIVSQNPEHPHEVLYIGNYSPWKESWLTAVKQRLPLRRLAIYGNHWNERADLNIFKDSIIGRPLMGSSYALAIRAAKVSIAIHMGPATNGGWQDLVSTRTFEIPACKGFMLHIDNDEVRQLFTPGREIDVFGTKEELCEKIEFYLKDDSLREGMIERAYKRCVPAYSYDERARVIAEWVDRTPK